MHSCQPANPQGYGMTVHDLGVALGLVPICMLSLRPSALSVAIQSLITKLVIVLGLLKS